MAEEHKENVSGGMRITAGRWRIAVINQEIVSGGLWITAGRLIFAAINSENAANNELLAVIDSYDTAKVIRDAATRQMTPAMQIRIADGCRMLPEC